MNNEYENMKQDLEEDRTIGEPNFHSNQTSSIAGDGEILPAAADLQNHSNNEDWTVNAAASAGNISNMPDRTNSENYMAAAPNTNPLNEEKQDEWKMPEPVFRVSSGKKVEKSASPKPRLNLSANPPETSEKADSNTNIQPQPYISEEFTVSDGDVIEQSPAKAKSKSGRIAFIVVGFLVMTLFAVGFLIGIYFLFFR